MRERKCERSSVVDAPRCGRYRLKVRPPSLDKVVQDASPVVARVPGDFGRRVDLDGHDLADPPTLDDDHGRPDPPVVSTPLLAALNVGDDQRIADVGSRNDVSGRDRESTVGFGVRGRFQLDEESVLADVGGDAFQLEGLEAGPPEQCGVCGSEFPQSFCDILAPVARRWLLHGRDLVRGMLADNFV